MPTVNLNRCDSVPGRKVRVFLNQNVKCKRKPQTVGIQSQGRKVKVFLDNKNVMQTENPNNWDSEPGRKVKVFLDQKVR